MSLEPKRHFVRHARAAYSPVEFVVSSNCLFLSDCGLLRIPCASSLRAMTALPVDSSFVIPMVSMSNRCAPRVAGAEPVPPTSHDFDPAAAICGAPDGNVLNWGSRPNSFHQPFSLAM